MRWAVLGAGLLAAWGCGGTDPEELAALEAERVQLLESTVPKDAYWEEVARKGTVLRELKPVEAGIPGLEQRALQLAPRAVELEARIEEAESINQRLEGQVEEFRQRVRQQREQIAELESFLGPYRSDVAEKPPGPEEGDADPES